MAEEFTGFDEGTTAFLADLRANNDKAWFDANRPRFEEQVMAPARAFVASMGGALREIAPEVRAEPKVNGSIFRIHRDVRFSPDKSPFKDHLDFWFWDGTERRRALTGFYLRILPDEVGIGVGAHGFDKTQLHAYRDLVVSPAGKKLRDVVDEVAGHGFTVGDEQWKRTPAGWEEPDDERLASLLRHGSLHARVREDVPAVLTSKRFVSWCLTRWRKAAPLHVWLRDNLQG